MITNVYVGGFNLCFGCLRNGPYRWLDVRKLAETSLPENCVQTVRYFSARIIPPPGDPGRFIRQQTFLRALRTLPDVTVTLGHFLEREARRPLVNPPADSP